MEYCIKVLQAYSVLITWNKFKSVRYTLYTLECTVLLYVYIRTPLECVGLYLTTNFCVGTLEASVPPKTKTQTSPSLV